VVRAVLWRCNDDEHAKAACVERAGRGFSVVFEGFPERPNGPDDREDYGAAADDVDEQADLVPGDPVLDEGAGFTNNNRGDVGRLRAFMSRSWYWIG